VRSLVALAAAAGCVALPSVAQAAAKPGPPKPISDLCTKVSPSAVSSIVGFTVPAGTANSFSYTIDPKLGLKETSMSCTFSVPGTAADPFGSKNVSLTSEVFNQPVTVALLKQVEAAEQEKYAAQEKASHFKVSYQNYTGLGVTAIYYTITASFNIPGLPKGTTLPKGFSLPKGFGFAYSGIATLNGTQSYSAAVNNTTIAQSSLATLVGLAMKL
jgi:hypothetical protein